MALFENIKPTPVSMKALAGVFVAAIYVSITSCATIVNGSKQKMEINSFPDGAVIFINGLQEGITPHTIKVKRKNPIGTITLVKEGYEDHQIRTYRQMNSWTFGNLLSWGILGFAFDAITGGMYEVKPKYMDIQLRRKENIAKPFGR